MDANSEPRVAGRRGLIVVGVDGSPNSVAALRWAVAEQARCGGQLVVVSAWHPLAVPVPSAGVDQAAMQDALEGDAHRALGNLLRREAADALARGDVRGEVAAGSASDALLAAAADADLLVVGARGRGGFVGLLLGSVTRTCLHRARCPVVVVPAAEGAEAAGTGGGGAETGGAAAGRTGRIVVGVDGSDESRDALGWAAEEARCREALLRVVLAWSFLGQEGDDDWAGLDVGTTEADARASLEQVAARVDLSGLADHELVTICDLPVPALRRESQGADLLVVGSRGLGAVRGAWLGSVSRGVVDHAGCPVVVVR